MKVVIDTNVLLVSISGKSKYHWLYRKILNEDFRVSVSSEILNEYSEKISEFFSPQVADNVIASLLSLNNIELSKIYYSWNLINDDPSDNKFTDCFLASNSDYLITDDNHFSVVKKIEFPKVEILSLQEFQKLLG